MNFWKVIGIGLTVGLVAGGVGALLTNSIIYLWIGPPIGLFHAWPERNQGPGIGRPLLRTSLRSAFFMAMLLLLHWLVPPTR